jgi:hypothetical protein
MLPLFFGFFTDKFFLHSSSGKIYSSSGKICPWLTDKKEPAIDIAGLCLPLKPQKEKVRIFFHCSLILMFLSLSGDTPDKILRHYTFLPVRITLSGQTLA